MLDVGEKFFFYKFISYTTELREKFPSSEFSLNTEIYRLNFRIQSEKETPNSDFFHAGLGSTILSDCKKQIHS